MTTNPFRATSYIFDSVILTSPRFEQEDGVDITNVTAEINLYENLMIPYISGDIVIADSANLVSLIQFNGQERVRIRIAVDEQYALEKEFIVYSLRYQGKSKNDNTSVLVLSIIEEHGFLSNFKRLSWHFEGNIHDIVKDVFTSELGLEGSDLINNFGDEKPFQTVNFVVPNWTPLKFVDCLTKRATTEIGEPFFCYSSLREGVQFKSLASLLTTNPTNINQPYRYTQVQRNTEYNDEKRVILSVEFTESDNSIALAQQGALGMTYFNIDPFDPAKNDFTEFRITDHFDRKKEAGTTLNDFTPYDEQFEVDGNKLHELESQFYSQINTSQGFGVESKSFSEEPSISEHLHKVSRLSDLAILEKERYSIQIPGASLLETNNNTSIGRVVSVIMTSNLPAISDTPSEEVVDEKRGSVGALFLVTKCHHRFGLDNQYIASMEISRTDKNKRLEDSSGL